MNCRVNENCIGCELCTTICPEIFQMTDDGVAQASDEQVSPELIDAAKEALMSCPVEAIEEC